MPVLVSPGVADGVGGWRDYGVDPSQFSGTLMKTCERLVKEGRFVPSNPVGVLTSSYYEMQQNKVQLLGECTHTLFIFLRPVKNSVLPASNQYAPFNWSHDPVLGSLFII